MTRRSFVAALPLIAKAVDVYPSQSKRLRDPATEFEITRLSDPSFNSWLIPSPTRSISGRNSVLLYCSDRSGSAQAYRLDMKSGESRALTNASDMDRSTLALLPDERSICYFDGPVLKVANGSRVRSVYEPQDGWARTHSFIATEDGNHVIFGEKNGEKNRLRMVTLARGTASTVLELEKDITFIRPRPRRASILYGQADAAWLVDYTGENNRKLKIAGGSAVEALWSADGKSFSYLRIPESERELHELREHTPDSNEDKKIASTSQFISYARNADASVFAGVSRNKPSPYILILIRVGRRELTVAEHRAKDPRQVTVLFTPNSQRLLWNTDREGKSAIYSLAVEKFVEKTEESEG